MQITVAAKIFLKKVKKTDRVNYDFVFLLFFDGPFPYKYTS